MKKYVEDTLSNVDILSFEDYDIQDISFDKEHNQVNCVIQLTNAKLPIKFEQSIK